MKSECNIIRDLLPLCIEDMASPDSAVFVGKHLEKCEECRREMSRLKDPVLFEQKRGEWFSGHAPNYMEVLAEGGEELHNVVKNVRITRTDGQALYGEIMEDNQ